MENITFAMIKPTAFKKGYYGLILDRIYIAGFKLRAMKMTKVSPEVAKSFYKVHEGKPFFNDLINFISSGPVIVMILEKENAVADFRELIGSTNPIYAKEGSIRKDFATDLTQNAIHGSDSEENAKYELSHFFSLSEWI